MNDTWSFALANCNNLPNIISTKISSLEEHNATLQVFDDISFQDSCNSYIVLRVYIAIKKIYVDLLTSNEGDKNIFGEYLSEHLLNNTEIINILNLTLENVQNDSMDVYDLWIAFYQFAKQDSSCIIKTFLLLEHMHALSYVGNEERRETLSNIFYDNFLKEDEATVIKISLPQELYDNDITTNKRSLLYDYYYNKFSLCLESPSSSCLYYVCATYYWFIENGSPNNSDEDFLINKVENIETNDLKNFMFEGMYDNG